MMTQFFQVLKLISSIELILVSFMMTQFFQVLKHASELVSGEIVL